MWGQLEGSQSNHLGTVDSGLLRWHHPTFPGPRPQPSELQRADAAHAKHAESDVSTRTEVAVERLKRLRSAYIVHDPLSIHDTPGFTTVSPSPGRVHDMACTQGFGQWAFDPAGCKPDKTEFEAV